MFLAGNPDAGGIIQGSGGCRKICIARGTERARAAAIGSSPGSAAETFGVPPDGVCQGSEGKPVGQGMQRACEADRDAASKPRQAKKLKAAP
jgi:hypothetical protein